MVDIVEVPVIEVHGEGVGSGQLIKVAEKLKNAKNNLSEYMDCV